jgi:hypothetical protein
MHDDLFIVHLPVQDVLRYVINNCPDPGDPSNPTALFAPEAHQPVDWHRVFRTGLGNVLHINLGVPGVEQPDHPIEEHPAALYAAIALGWHTIPVILSGEIELAVSRGLASKKAISKLRNAIRDSV